jgi:acyl carrier protein
LTSRLRAVSETEREEVVLDLVRGEVAVILGHTSARAVDARRAFKELGFDSLAAIELRNRMNDATGLRLAATLVFDHPTPATLTRYLLSQLTSNGAAAGAQLDSELERLEATVASIGPSSPAGEAIADRLRALLARWAEVPQPTGRVIGAEEIDAASDEEIFALLDGNPRSTGTHEEPSQPTLSERADD